MSEVADIQTKDDLKFAYDFQLFDNHTDGSVWIVFRSQDGTVMAVNFIDIENAVKIRHATDTPKVDDAPSK